MISDIFCIHTDPNVFVSLHETAVKWLITGGKGKVAEEMAAVQRFRSSLFRGKRPHAPPDCSQRDEHHPFLTFEITV